MATPVLMLELNDAISRDRFGTADRMRNTDTVRGLPTPGRRGGAAQLIGTALVRAGRHLIGDSDSASRPEPALH